MKLLLWIYTEYNRRPDECTCQTQAVLHFLQCSPPLLFNKVPLLVEFRPDESRSHGGLDFFHINEIFGNSLEKLSEDEGMTFFGCCCDEHIKIGDEYSMD